MKNVPAGANRSRRYRGPDRWLIVRLCGAGLLIATGAIHLDLYVTGYRTIPTIGWLFLLQLITAFVLGVAVLVARSRLLALMGASFAIATLGGYLLSLRIGLLGFREVRTSAGIVAGVIEVATFAALVAFALRPVPGQHLVGSPSGANGTVELVQAAIPSARWVALVFLGAAGALLGLALAATETTPTTGSSGAIVRIGEVHGRSVLTDAGGLTLYWFVPDSSTKSTCYGTCAAYWPPLTGSPVAGPGVDGKLGTIGRQGGAIQVTYENHPLYTYVGDSAPGQDNGNNVNLNGGLWHEMLAAG